MKTLALANGDLVVGPTGHQTVSGTAKIRQELALALGEEYGNDRFHPTLGSVLIDFIGQPVTDEMTMLIRAEVGRVIQQYVAVQQREVLLDNLAARRSRFDSSDVVTGVTSVQAVVSLDSVQVTVSLTTQAGATVTINRTVTP
jgi:phage baseplate assembly protein W